MWKTSEKVTFTQPLANSTAEGNEERIHASVESSRSWETRAAWAGLLDGDSETPRCSSSARWRFEPQSNMPLLSVLGRIAPWLLL